MLQIDPEERLDIVQIIGENAVVHAAGTHGASRHQEAVLHGIADVTGEVVAEGGVADVVELVLPAAVGDDRDGTLGTEQAGGEQHRVGAAGDVQDAVGIKGENLPEHLQHFLGVKHAGTVKDEFHMQAAVPEIKAELVLEIQIGGNAARADVYDPFRMEHIHAENVFQRPFIVEFDQGFHHGAPFLKCDYNHYNRKYAPAQDGRVFFGQKNSRAGTEEPTRTA